MDKGVGVVGWVVEVLGHGQEYSVGMEMGIGGGHVDGVWGREGGGDGTWRW